MAERPLDREVRGQTPQKGNDVTPQTTIQGLTFFPVPDFDGPTASFGAPASAFFDRRNLPNVPKKFEDMAQGLFFSGGKLPDFSPKVDRKKAFAALSAWLGSFAPAHEAKIATAAYALWLWTDDAAMAVVPDVEPEKTAKTKRGSARAQRRHGMAPNGPHERAAEGGPLDAVVGR